MMRHRGGIIMGQGSMTGKRMWTFGFALLSVAGAALAFEAAGPGKISIKDVIFDRAARVGDRDLPARGGTLCRHRTFKVYTALLYASPEARSVKSLLGPSAKRLVLHYHREISKEDIAEASERTLKSHPKLDIKKLRERLDRIYSWYEDVEEGDRFWLDYVPGKGCELFFNGKSKGVIEGDDFAEAYFGIWLSDYSISDTYRDRLLGKS